MYNKLELALKYCRYYLTASNSRGHGMHSPFVFQFIIRILNDDKQYPEYQKVEDLRTALLGNHSELELQDFGAGSVAGNSSRRKIASIARNAAKPKKFGQLLHRMVKYYAPKLVLELGTSLGVTTSYLSSANAASRFITMEGAPAIAATAQQNFDALGLTNIQIITGNFDDTLPPLLTELTLRQSIIDLAFVDGNHRMEPTLRYFQQLLPLTDNDSILIFDDIHWSSGMEKAWQTIKAHPSVTCSLDLFFIGVIFFRNEFKEKIEYTIRF